MIYYLSSDLCWFRLFGVDVAVKRTPPLFSERHGYRKTLRLGGEWRLEFLRR